MTAVSLSRRALLVAGVAIVTLPARGAVPRLSISGALEQGGLAIGHAGDDARVRIDGQEAHVAADGTFAFGFAYDRTTPLHVTAIFADGTSESLECTPAIRKYEIQHINGLPQQFVTPPPETIARIRRESALIGEARTRDTDGLDFVNGFDWPAPGILSGVFGSQRIDNGVAMAPHFGVDMAAPVGTPIHAPADGVVSISDDYYLDGGFTLLDHGHGVSTCYLHQSRRIVKAGEAVRRGQLMGLIGRTGRATGPHLHWAMNWFQVKLDPSLSTRTSAPRRL